MKDEINNCFNYYQIKKAEAFGNFCGETMHIDMPLKMTSSTIFNVVMSGKQLRIVCIWVISQVATALYNNQE